VRVKRRHFINIYVFFYLFEAPLKIFKLFSCYYNYKKKEKITKNLLFVLLNIRKLKNKKFSFCSFLEILLKRTKRNNASMISSFALY
jgi:hypothetical protein